MWKKIIKIILVLIISALVSYGVARLGGHPFGHHYKFSINVLLGFFIASVLIQKDKVLFLAAIFPTIVLSIIIHFYLVDLTFFQLAIPSTLAFFIGLVLGWLFLKNITLKVITSLIVIGLVSISGVLYGYWVHKTAYNTFFGEVNIVLNEDDRLTFLDENDMSVSLENNKPLVLYFWNNYCAVCMETIPVFDQFNLKYKDIAEFYLINVIENQDLSNIVRYKKTTLSRLKKAEVKYTKNLYFLKANSEMLNKYQVYAYPTILIIEDEQIKFIGNTLTLKNVIKKL